MKIRQATLDGSAIARAGQRHGIVEGVLLGGGTPSWGRLREHSLTDEDAAAMTEPIDKKGRNA